MPDDLHVLHNDRGMAGRKVTSYGLPYQGGKSQIADDIMRWLPSSRLLVDAFAGGCAVTHAALLSGRFGHVVANDLGDAPSLFVDVCNGRYADERRWISREEFFRLRESDIFVALVWSFANNMNCYIYAEEIEEWKKALHYARVFGDRSLLRRFGIESDGSARDIASHADEYVQKYIRWMFGQKGYGGMDIDAAVKAANRKADYVEAELRRYLVDALKDSGLTQKEVDRRLGNQMSGHYFGQSQWAFPTEDNYLLMQQWMPALIIPYCLIYRQFEFRKIAQSLESLQSLQRLQRLQELQSLERLQRLQGLQGLKVEGRLTVSQADYRSFSVPDDAVVYCDPPYYGTDTGGYVSMGGNTFDSAAFHDWCRVQRALVVVSEYQMPDDFVCIAQFSHQNLLGKNNVVKERLFVPGHQRQEYMQRMGLLLL